MDFTRYLSISNINAKFIKFRELIDTAVTQCSVWLFVGGSQQPCQAGHPCLCPAGGLSTSGPGYPWQSSGEEVTGRYVDAIPGWKTGQRQQPRGTYCNLTPSLLRPLVFSLSRQDIEWPVLPKFWKSSFHSKFSLMNVLLALKFIINMAPYVNNMFTEGHHDSWVCVTCKTTWQL